MAIWARVAGDIDLDAWVQAGEALGVPLSRRRHVRLLRGRPLPYLRLGFTYHNEAELADAAARMARAWTAVAKGAPIGAKLGSLPAMKPE